MQAGPAKIDRVRKDRSGWKSMCPHTLSPATERERESFKVRQRDRFMFRQKKEAVLGSGLVRERKREREIHAWFRTERFRYRLRDRCRIILRHRWHCRSQRNCYPQSCRKIRRIQRGWSRKAAGCWRQKTGNQVRLCMIISDASWKNSDTLLLKKITSILESLSADCNWVI